MLSRKYGQINDKIKVLENYKFLDKLQKLKEEFLTIGSRNFDKTEQNFEEEILACDFLSRLNFLCQEEYPLFIQKNFYEIGNFSVHEKVPICPLCEIKLMIRDSKNICNHCGYYELLDNLYFREKNKKPSNKNKNQPDIYCIEWINYIQGKTNLIIEDEKFNLLKNLAIKKIGDNIKNIAYLTCDNIRIWLKQLKLTKFNKFIPALHKRLTRELGYEIAPPQFSNKEEKDILEFWSLISEEYCRKYSMIRSKKVLDKSNNPYYPICILFIVKKLYGDARANIVEKYIHKQSLETYNLRLQCWELTYDALYDEIETFIKLKKN